MGSITVEPEPPVRETPCARCRGTQRAARGYVYDDGHPFGMYLVEWCDGAHPERAAFLSVGLGGFGEGTGPADRMAFGLEWRAAGVGLTEEPLRDAPELLGRFVPRSEALGLADLDRLWHVVDHIVLDDERLAAVQAWLAGG